MRLAIGIIGSGVALLLLSMALQRWSSRRLWRKFPAPGELIDVGGHRLHLDRRGHGAPTVVFDSALAGTSISWGLVQPAVSEFTTTCSYDRAGSGWSDPGPFPRDGETIATELRRLLARANAPEPFILVGHSYGGFTVRLFADRYPEVTAGMILLDAADPDQWAEPNAVDRRKVWGGSRLSRRGAHLARFGVARLLVWLATLGASRVAWRFGGLFSRHVPESEKNRLVAPAAKLPPQDRRKLLWFWTEAKFYEALASQIENVPKTAAAVVQTGPYADVPIVVLSAPNPDPNWEPRQAEMAALSNRGRHLAVSNSGHWIPLDRPDLVVEVIREMVGTVRSAQAVWLGCSL